MRNVVFTQHALERFVERVSPGISLDQASQILHHRWRDAAPLRQKTRNGQNCFKIVEPEAFLVCKDDTDGVICVTVLSPEDFGFFLTNPGTDHDDEEQEVVIPWLSRKRALISMTVDYDLDFAAPSSGSLVPEKIKNVCSSALKAGYKFRGATVASVDVTVSSVDMRTDEKATVEDEDLNRMAPEELRAEVRRLREGIRRHRDSTGHDLCWWHPEMWGLLPEGKMKLPVAPPREEFLRRCAMYRDSME